MRTRNFSCHSSTSSSSSAFIQRQASQEEGSNSAAPTSITAVQEDTETETPEQALTDLRDANAAKSVNSSAENRDGDEIQEEMDVDLDGLHEQLDLLLQNDDDDDDGDDQQDQQDQQEEEEEGAFSNPIPFSPSTTTSIPTRTTFHPEMSTNSYDPSASTRQSRNQKVTSHTQNVRVDPKKSSSSSFSIPSRPIPFPSLPSDSGSETLFSSTSDSSSFETGNSSHQATTTSSNRSHPRSVSTASKLARATTIRSSKSSINGDGQNRKFDSSQNQGASQSTSSSSSGENRIVPVTAVPLPGRGRPRKVREPDSNGKEPVQLTPSARPKRGRKRKNQLGVETSVPVWNASEQPSPALPPPLFTSSGRQIRRAVPSSDSTPSDPASPLVEVHQENVEESSIAPSNQEVHQVSDQEAISSQALEEEPNLSPVVGSEEVENHGEGEEADEEVENAGEEQGEERGEEEAEEEVEVDVEKAGETEEGGKVEEPEEVEQADRKPGEDLQIIRRTIQTRLQQRIEAKDLDDPSATTSIEESIQKAASKGKSIREASSGGKLIPKASSSKPPSEEALRKREQRARSKSSAGLEPVMIGRDIPDLQKGSRRSTRRERQVKEQNAETREESPWQRAHYPRRFHNPKFTMDRKASLAVAGESLLNLRQTNAIADATASSSIPESGKESMQENEGAQEETLDLQKDAHSAGKEDENETKEMEGIEKTHSGSSLEIEIQSSSAPRVLTSQAPNPPPAESDQSRSEQVQIDGIHLDSNDAIVPALPRLTSASKRKQVEIEKGNDLQNLPSKRSRMMPEAEEMERGDRRQSQGREDLGPTQIQEQDETQSQIQTQTRKRAPSEAQSQTQDQEKQALQPLRIETPGETAPALQPATTTSSSIPILPPITQVSSSASGRGRGRPRKSDSQNQSSVIPRKPKKTKLKSGGNLNPELLSRPGHLPLLNWPPSTASAFKIEEALQPLRETLKSRYDFLRADLYKLKLEAHVLSHADEILKEKFKDVDRERLDKLVSISSLPQARKTLPLENQGGKPMEPQGEFRIRHSWNLQPKLPGNEEFLEDAEKTLADRHKPIHNTGYNSGGGNGSRKGKGPIRGVGGNYQKALTERTQSTFNQGSGGSGPNNKRNRQNADEAGDEVQDMLDAMGLEALLDDDNYRFGHQSSEPPNFRQGTSKDQRNGDGQFQGEALESINSILAFNEGKLPSFEEYLSVKGGNPIESLLGIPDLLEKNPRTNSTSKSSVGDSSTNKPNSQVQDASSATSIYDEFNISLLADIAAGNENQGNSRSNSGGSGSNSNSQSISHSNSSSNANANANTDTNGHGHEEGWKDFDEVDSFMNNLFSGISKE